MGKQTSPRLFMRWSHSLRVSSLMRSLFLLLLQRSHILGWMSSVSLTDVILVSSWPSSTSLSVSEEVNEKFCNAADDKKAFTALPRWGDVYCLGDLDTFHKAPKINESFSRPLDKTISSSHYVALSLDDTAKLETRVCGLI